ncbi:MAG: DUF5703 domain-containing protein [Verrucomicrobiota bacterium]
MRAGLAIALFLNVSVLAGEGPFWTDQYDVEWTTPSDNGPMDSMPFGGGDIGCNIWVEDGEVFLYAQKSGSFNELGEYVKLGRFRLNFTPNSFEDPQRFRQKLHLQDGSVYLTAVSEFEIRVRTWVDVFTSSIHLTVDSDEPVDYKISFETWRYEDKLLEEPPKDPKMSNSSRWGSYSLVAYPGEVWKLRDQYDFDGDSVLFYHRNPAETQAHYVELEQQDMMAFKDEIYDGKKNLTFGGKMFGTSAVRGTRGMGEYLNRDYEYLSLVSSEKAKNHHIVIATHLAQEEQFESWRSNMDRIGLETKASLGNTDENREWWRSFWDRSWVVIEPDSTDHENPLWKLGQIYQLGRYQFGCNFYGSSPTKFNGGSFTVDPFKNQFDPDWRQWGGDYHTAQNQRLIYWPMLKMGDFDAMPAQFDLYRHGLRGAEIRVEKYFGHEGAYYSENTSTSGLVMGLAWCWPPNDHSPQKRIRPEEVPFGDPRIRGFTKGFAEEGMQYNASCGYHFTAPLEHAYMIMEYHRYSGNSIEEYIPFIKSSVIFFDQHYQKRQMMRTGEPFDDRGKLYISPAMALETGSMANPMDLVAGLEACLESLIELDSPSISEEDRAYYREFLDRLPPTPFYVEHEGRTMLAPGEGVYRSKPQKEVPQFYPLYPFDRITPADTEEMAVARETWLHDTSLAKDRIFGWQQKNIFAARAGFADDAMDLSVRKIFDGRKLMRFPSFLGPMYDWIPDHNWLGASMIGIQEMLMQCFGDTIYLLPAWPFDVDVDFKLHAPERTTVEVSFRSGKIEKLIVTPESRRDDVVFMQRGFSADLN